MKSIEKALQAAGAPVQTGDVRDDSSPDAAVDALYASLSFGPGGSADWDRLRKLFLPNARIVPPPPKSGGAVEAVDIETYIARSRPGMDAPEIRSAGIQEIEAARNVVEFGDLAHILSSTETIVGPENSEPISRGINSVQLVRSAGCWLISGFLWDTERPGNPLPPGYLP